MGERLDHELELLDAMFSEPPVDDFVDWDELIDSYAEVDDRPLHEDER